MKKTVIFLAFRDRPCATKALPYVDGVVYSTGTNNGRADSANYARSLDGCVGEYVSIEQDDEGNIRVVTDFCGFYPLFWKRHVHGGQDGVLVSNCFHSLASYTDGQFEPAKVFPNLFSKSQVFIQDYSDDTSIEGIRRLAWDEELVVMRDRIDLRKRVFSGESDYTRLLEMGIASSVTAMRQIARGGALNLYLSGGKDSRAILAMLLSAGMKPACTTQNPASYNGNSPGIVEKDFGIAVALVQKYGLKWHRASPKVLVRSDFMECLERANFYRTGYYLHTSGQYLAHNKVSGLETQLRGAGGGLYKSTWGQYIKESYLNKKLEGTSGALLDDAGVIYDGLVSAKFVLSDPTLSGRTRFVSSIEQLAEQYECPSVYAALDRHYVSFRNRTHFGHIRSSDSLGTGVFYPLINEYFVQACALLSKDERDNGRLVYDIIEHCLPELNELPYDTGYHELLPGDRKRATFDEADTALENYRLNLERNKKAARVTLKSGVAFDPVASESDFIRQALKELEPALNQHRGYDQKAFQSYVDSLIPDKKFRGKLCALLSSLPLEAVSSFADGHLFTQIR